MYESLCTIVMDLSHLPYETHVRAGGKVYHEVVYAYLLHYEGMQLMAQLAWTEHVSTTNCSSIGRLSTWLHSVGSREEESSKGGL